MATGTFFYPDKPSGVSISAGPGVISSGDIAISIAGVTLNSVLYWKDASDTGTHNITVYRTSDQSVVGTGTFSGETPSGWQTFTFGSPLSLPTGFSYRVAVSTPTSHSYGGFTMPGSAMPSGVTQGTSSYYISGATTGYPNTAYAGWQDVDMVLGGLTFNTFARASQVVDETWATLTPKLAVSQVIAEAWIQNQPPTGVYASQVVAEGWVTMRSPNVQLIASQIVAEVWLGPPPSGKPLWVSAQTI